MALAAATLLAAGCGAAPIDAARTALSPTPAHGTFPDIDESVLTAGQRRFLGVVRAEHAAQRPATTYSQGVEEPWCADFVTWVARESGAPLANPHSGGWRILGVLTLREALRASGAWRPADGRYTPKLGDIVLYDDPSPLGQHTNYVLAHREGEITTVGGNERGGVSVTTHRLTPELTILGYGAR